MRGRGGRDGHNTRKNTYTRRHEGVNAKNKPAHCFVLIWFEAVHNIIHLLYALHVYDSIWPNMQTLNIQIFVYFLYFYDFNSFILLTYWFLMSPKEHKRICQCLVSIVLMAYTRLLSFLKYIFLWPMVEFCHWYTESAPFCWREKRSYYH